MATAQELFNKRTKIICTMGPATDDDNVLRQLMENGMNVARFNFSHGSHEYHRNNIERVRRIAAEVGTTVAIMLDTKGPEIRTGLLEDHQKVTLEEGKQFVLTTEDVIGTVDRVSVTYKDMPNDVAPGSTILVDDGLIGLEVEKVEGTEIVCKIMNGGVLSERKGINIPGANIGLPSVTEQDIADIKLGCQLGIDAIAASFIRDGAAVDEIRNLCAEMDQSDILIFSKIECSLAVQNYKEIIDHSDGIMVARGDLGVEIPEEQVPYVQKQIINRCNKTYKSVITATQMLDSMIRNPRPTRAEVADVANAVYDGTDCVMLSGETAAGQYPVKAVRTMASICLETEKHRGEARVMPVREGIRNVNTTIGVESVVIADSVKATAILCPTHTGRTARLIAASRPHQPIYAFSSMEAALRRMCFYWGVKGILTDEQDTHIDATYNAIEESKKRGFTKEGDLVIVMAGDPATTPYDDEYVSSTNMITVAQVR
ncbi:MAG: pyruvate kinase [Atopobiaceae bacterium]|nr:pyruvate kinase [Atopobiaceae bacterium]